MPAAARPRRQPTDDWQQLRLLVTSSEQAAYELVRPTVLFGQLPRERAHETGVSERTLRCKVARFAAAGMRSLFEPDDPPAADQRSLPLGIRKAIVELYVLKQVVYRMGEPSADAHQRMKAAVYLLGRVSSPIVRPPCCRCRARWWPAWHGISNGLA
jgi:hypothetical protein